jgi:hypothetical protein
MKPVSEFKLNDDAKLIMGIILIFLLFAFFITVFLCMVFKPNSGFENFASGKIVKPDVGETLSEKWDSRWNSLKELNIEKYRKYFSPVANERNFSDVIFKPGKIFVSIASYKDDQCPDTLKNIAEQADNPEDLTIVICQQNSIVDRDCLKWCQYGIDKDSKACKESNVSIERLADTDARGPTYARWKIQQKWDGEEYFLQVDSHTRMIPHWDTILKNQLNSLGGKAVLTNYPLEYDIVSKNKRNDSNHENWRTDKRRSSLFVDRFGEEGFFRIQSNYTDAIHSKPIPGIALAGGLIFTKGNFIKEVPYDKYTGFLFFGEETDLAIRAYTNGWDLYSPTGNVCFHNYSRGHRSTFWEHPDQKGCEILSRFRLYHRFGMINEDDLPPNVAALILTDQIPLGTVRTLDEYERTANIDMKQETSNNK